MLESYLHQPTHKIGEIMRYFKDSGTKKQPNTIPTAKANYFCKDSQWVIQTEEAMNLPEISEAEASIITGGIFPFIAPPAPLGL